MNRVTLHDVSAVEVEHKASNDTYWTDFTFITRDGVRFQVTAFTSTRDTLKGISNDPRY